MVVVIGKYILLVSVVYIPQSLLPFFYRPEDGREHFSGIDLKYSRHALTIQTIDFDGSYIRR